MTHEQVRCFDEAANHQLPVAGGFWIIRIVSGEECSSLMQNWCRFVALLAQSFWMWQPHRHMLTQKHLPPPLTSTGKSSLFTHTHSSPLSLAARLHWCWANHSHYFNNGWNFSGQTLCVCIHMNTHMYSFICYSSFFFKSHTDEFNDCCSAISDISTII